MASGWMQEVVGEVAFPGVVAQVVDSHYEAGATASQCDPEIVLRWRSAPKGRIRAWTEGRDPRSVGQMMLIPSRVQTSAMACDGAVDTRSLALRIKPEWLQDVVGETARSLDYPALALFQFKETNIEYAMRRMFNEVLSPGPLTPSIIKSCSTLVAFDLVSRLKQGTTELRIRDPLSELRARHVEEFVMTYEGGWPSLQEIADSLGIGVGHMRQVYKNCTGRNLFDYMDEVRISRAKVLLQEGTIPLKVIAHRLGFSTPSAFSYAFRHKAGLTPREYRIASLRRSHTKSC